MRNASHLLALVLAACGSEPVLYVDVTSDLRAGVEADRVRIIVTSDDPSAPFEDVVVEAPLDRSDNLTRFRAADVSGLPFGRLHVRGELYLGERFLVGDGIRTGFTATHAVEVRLYRDCIGVEACDVPDCASDAQCAGMGECGSGACLAGGCGVLLDDARCEDGTCGEDFACHVPPADGCVRSAELCNELDDDCDGAIDEDFADDPSSCEACGVACPSGPRATATCADRECGLACDRGFADCDGAPENGCEAALDSAPTCGSCGNACGGASPLCTIEGGVPRCTSACPSGQTECAGSCADTSSSLSHCGGCDRACVLPNATEVCSGGLCRISGCDARWDDCDGDPANGCETSLRAPTSCGACGFVCALPNATSTCSAMGACAIVDCNAGFDDCDGNPANGCETSLRTLTSCGACGMACALGRATESCATGTCRLVACDPGYADCDGTRGCEVTLGTRTACRACGDVCDANETCDPAAGCLCNGVSCREDQACCRGEGAGVQCLDLLTTESDCGACEAECGDNEQCVDGRCQCGGTAGGVGAGSICEPDGRTCCRDTQSHCVLTGTSEQHCGGCNIPCGTMCRMGVCQ